MKVIMVVLNLIIASIFFTLIYSAVNIDVSIPTQRSVNYNLEGTNLSMSFPVSIKNNGIYPVENLSINVGIFNSTQKIFMHHFNLGKIEPFQKFAKILSFQINLMEVYKKLGNYYIFHGGTFRMNIKIHARYWVLADFDANYWRDIEWSPLIYHYQIYYDEISFKEGTIEVPYFISKIPINMNATITANIVDKKGILAMGKSEVVFDRKAYLPLRMVRNYDYLLTTSEPWEIDYSINIGVSEIKGSVNYKWVAPLSHLCISEEIDNGTLNLYLEMKNNMKRDMNLEMVETVIHNGMYENKTINFTVRSGEYARIPLVEMESGTYEIYLLIIEKDFNMKYSLEYSAGGEP